MVFGTGDKTTVLVEQYKLAAEHLMSGLTRREELSRFYLSVNAALVAFGSAIADRVDDDRLLLLPITLAGLLACGSWVAQLVVMRRSLRNRQRAVVEMERGLPAQPFTRGPASGQFVRLATVGRYALPAVFAALYIATALTIVVAASVD